jgi:hypothetical protein
VGIGSNLWSWQRAQLTVRPRNAREGDVDLFIGDIHQKFFAIRFEEIFRDRAPGKPVAIHFWWPVIVVFEPEKVARDLLAMKSLYGLSLLSTSIT